MGEFFVVRLMVPSAGGRGRAIAFGGRGLNPDAKPKYNNTGETALFSKGTQLYNFATARGAAIKAGTIILAEGYMDVIALVRAGFAGRRPPGRASQGSGPDVCCMGSGPGSAQAATTKSRRSHCSWSSSVN